MRTSTVSARIFLIANLVLLGLVIIVTGQVNIGMLMLVGFFSILISLPAFFLLWAVLHLIRELRASVFASWIIYIHFLFLTSLVPTWLLSLCINDGSFWELSDLTTLSTVSAFAASLFQCLPLHDLFKSINHEQESAFD